MSRRMTLNTKLHLRVLAGTVSLENAYRDVFLAFSPSIRTSTVY